MSDTENFDGPTVEPDNYVRAADGTVRAVEPDEAPLVSQAWDANVAAVQDARMALRAARLRAGQVEDRVTAQARKRDPRRPLLNAAEHAELEQEYADVDAARAANAEAGRRFKAGVTAEQIQLVRNP
ncbi:MAG: hypothetical protein GEV04_25135, partial [Actinophytocola sp.]|nr:hypothetical protein [Actinophytocola sp.]